MGEGRITLGGEGEGSEAEAAKPLIFSDLRGECPKTRHTVIIVCSLSYHVQDTQLSKLFKTESLEKRLMFTGKMIYFNIFPVKISLSS